MGTEVLELVPSDSDSCSGDGDWRDDRVALCCCVSTLLVSSLSFLLRVARGQDLTPNSLHFFLTVVVETP
eukprot:1296165-Rhodomonas_salina.1